MMRNFDHCLTSYVVWHESIFEDREANINVNDFIFKYMVSFGCPQGGITVATQSFRTAERS